MNFEECNPAIPNKLKSDYEKIQAIINPKLPARTWKVKYANGFEMEIKASGFQLLTVTQKIAFLDEREQAIVFIPMEGIPNIRCV